MMRENITMNTLSNYKVGDQGQVVNLAHSHPLYRQKLLSMGLTPGTRFVVKRIAPLGDPIEIAVRGYSLSLRKHEAAILQVERV